MVRTLSNPSLFTRATTGLLAVVALAGLALGSSLAAGSASVTIDNFAFTPAAITVKPGTIVTFENHDDIPHSIVDADGKFHSHPLDTNDTFQVTFNEPGEYTYYCGLHPHMKGKVVVAP